MRFCYLSTHLFIERQYLELPLLISRHRLLLSDRGFLLLSSEFSSGSRIKRGFLIRPMNRRSKEHKVINDLFCLRRYCFVPYFNTVFRETEAQGSLNGTWTV